MYDGTTVFNDGEMQWYYFFKQLGLKVGYHKKTPGFRKLDSNRVRSSEKQMRKRNKYKTRPKSAERTIMSVQEANGDGSYQLGPS